MLRGPASLENHLSRLLDRHPREDLVDNAVGRVPVRRDAAIGLLALRNYKGQATVLTLVQRRLALFELSLLLELEPICLEEFED